MFMYAFIGAFPNTGKTILIFLLPRLRNNSSKLAPQIRAPTPPPPPRSSTSPSTHQTRQQVLLHDAKHKDNFRDNPMDNHRRWDHRTVVRSNKESRRKCWVTRSSVSFTQTTRSFTRTAHSFAWSTALIRLLARSLAQSRARGKVYNLMAILS